jgi:hypothetical protein
MNKIENEYRHLAMLRISALFLLLSLACGKAFAGIGVELDVVFTDSIAQYRCLYVLAPDTNDRNDTLAKFDSLSFNGKNSVSLFYAVDFDGENSLSLVDSCGVSIESKPFRVSPKRTVFSVVVESEQIKVSNRDFLYPQKNDDERSYYAFLLIFFAVKILISAVFIFASKVPKRIIAVAAGAFLLSSLVDWFFPINYLYRLLLTMLVEYLLISLVGGKSISWLRAAVLVFVVNVAGFGTIALLYILHVFW